MQYGPKIVTDGLVLALDAADRNSYLKFSRINMSNWTVGSGSVTGFGINGSVSENQRLLGTDPFGQSAIVWGTYPLGDNGADGGWETDNDYGINKANMYRFSVWVKRISTTTSGSFYLGCQSWVASDYVKRMSDNVDEPNPYWWYPNIGDLTKDVWYLVVGHLYPFNTIYTGRHPDSGVYNVGSTTKVANISGNTGGGDFKFSATGTYLKQRVYHYYSTDTTSQLQFYDPRIDLVDGTEPSIYELVNRSAVRWNDAGGQLNNFNLYNYPLYSNGAFVFNGTNNYANIGTSTGFFNNSTNNFYADVGYAWTISIWFKFPVSPTTVRDGTIAGGNCSYCMIGNSGGIGGAETIALFVSGSGGTTAGFHPYYCVIGVRGSKTQLSTASVNTNTWNHVAATWNGSVGRGYFNGVDRGPLNIGANGMQISAPAIGTTNNNASGTAVQNFEGSMSQVLVYNRALTPVEVSQIYNTSKGRFGL